MGGRFHFILRRQQQDTTTNKVLEADELCRGVTQVIDIKTILTSLKDGVMYPKDRFFSPSDLLTIQPSHVVEFFCLKVYGTPYPKADAKPIWKIN